MPGRCVYVGGGNEQEGGQKGLANLVGRTVLAVGKDAGRVWRAYRKCGSTWNTCVLRRKPLGVEPRGRTEEHRGCEGLLSW